MKIKKIVLCVLVITYNLIYSQSFEDALRPFKYISPEIGYSSVFNSNATLIRDISSLYTNPANLALINKSQIYFSFQNNTVKQYAEPYGIANSSFKQSDYSNFSGVGVIWDVPVYRGNLAIGVSYFSVSNYDMLLKSEGIYPVNNGTENVYNNYTISENGLLYVLSIGTSVEFRKNLFLGASFNKYDGYRNYDFNGYEIDTLDIYAHYYWNYIEKIEPTYTGRNITAGMTYVYKSFIYGVRISSPLKLNSTENFKIEERVIEDDNKNILLLNSYSDTTDYSMKYPIEYSVSFGYKSTALELSLNTTFHSWNDIKFFSNLYEIDDNNDTVKIDRRINREIRSNLKQTYDIDFGLIFHATTNVDFLFNYQLRTKPYKDINSEFRNINQISMGIKFSIGNLDIITSYKFITSKDLIEIYYFGTQTSQRLQKHRFNITTVLNM
ncbi:MAG: hypothetical protein H0Z29_08930 [Candidatus Marinimicrobia bacterium]|nr:hypothetical protein [Candidatus Neomarinimicrobiota bacterium]